jgi:hypothetical protein
VRAPAVPLSDEVTAASLLTIQGELADLLCAVPPARQDLVDMVLVVLGIALSRLGYRYPEEEQ